MKVILRLFCIVSLIVSVSSAIFDTPLKIGCYAREKSAFKINNFHFYLNKKGMLELSGSKTLIPFLQNFFGKNYKTFIFHVMGPSQSLNPYTYLKKYQADPRTKSGRMAAEWARENHSSVCIIEAVSSVWSKLFIESRVPHMANILAKLLSTLKLLKYIRPKSKVILSGVGPAALLVGKTGRILQENTQLHIVPDLILAIEPPANFEKRPKITLESTDAKVVKILRTTKPSDHEIKNFAVFVVNKEHASFECPCDLDIVGYNNEHKNGLTKDSFDVASFEKTSGIYDVFIDGNKLKQKCVKEPR